MGKLMDRLQKQLKNPDTKRDAEDCIKIYNWIKDTDKDGKVWESRWTPMVNVRWEGTHPNSLAIYKPNIIGYTLLKGIECLRTLKDLTQEECIKIASIAKPDVEWKFVQSADKWDGFDLVEKDCENIAKYIFQIDYRSSEELKSKPRFRIYEDLHEYSVNIEAIINYLMSIGCTAS